MISDYSHIKKPSPEGLLPELELNGEISPKIPKGGYLKLDNFRKIHYYIPILGYQQDIST